MPSATQGPAALGRLGAGRSRRPERAGASAGDTQAAGDGVRSSVAPNSIPVWYIGTEVRSAVVGMQADHADTPRFPGELRADVFSTVFLFRACETNHL